MHLRTNAVGLPIVAEITGGEVSDCKGYEAATAAYGPVPQVLLADKGYDSDQIRTSLEAGGAVPMIPVRRNRKHPVQIDDFVYGLRNRTEGRLDKRRCSRSLATRYDTTADSYVGFIYLASIRLWCCGGPDRDAQGRTRN